MRKSSQVIFLLLSLTIPLYFGLIALGYSLSQPHIVQDDARLHIVWFQQWIDPALFPNDLIARYYQSIQAAGFKAFYWIFAQLGIEPLFLAKLLPTVLALIATGYLFFLTLELLPLPLCGFITTLLLNQTMWIKDDLISATPRAFVYPLLTAFLYYLLRRSAIGCLTTIALSGLFYPQIVLVQLGTLTVQLFQWQSGICLTRDRQAFWLWFAGIGIAVLVILPFQQQTTQAFGPMLTAAEMQQMPEFGLNGRRAYFGVDFLRYSFAGASGLRLPLFPPILWASVGLPFLLRTRYQATQAISPKVKRLAEVGLASLGLFFLAHWLFPKLYLPSRYTFYSFRVVMVIAAGIVLSLSLTAGWRWSCRRLALWHSISSLQKRLITGLGITIMVAFTTAVVVLPAIPALFLEGQGWIVGEHPQIYRFLADQPKDILIASLTRETDNLPAFTKRSVLVSRELALAYHPAFYAAMQQRIVDLIRAQYSPNLADIQSVLQKYGIDFLLIDQEFAMPNYLTQQDWLIHSSFQQQVWQVIDQLRQGMTPALNQAVETCTAVSENNLIILKADCISEIQSK